MPSSSSHLSHHHQIWQTALRSLKQRLRSPSKQIEFRSAPLNAPQQDHDSALRKCLRDVRLHHSWQKSLQVFGAAVLSGNALIDNGTFRENVLSCRCGLCRQKVRCTGAALMCLAEDSSSTTTKRTDSQILDLLAIRRLASGHPWMMQTNSSTKKSSSNDSLGIPLLSTISY